MCLGIVTLISNLFRSCGSIPKNKNPKGWEKEYIHGLSLEVYATKLPMAFYHLSFSQAAQLLYQCTNGEVILMGVLDYDCTTTPSLYINPGNTMVMGAHQMVYVLSESKKLAQTSSISEQLKVWLNAGHLLPPLQKIPTIPVDSKNRTNVTSAGQDGQDGQDGQEGHERRVDSILLEEAIDPQTGKELENHIIVVTDLDETSLKIFIKPLRSHLVEGRDIAHGQQLLFISWSTKEQEERAIKILQPFENIFLMIVSEFTRRI
jgi:hypothetical protein